MSSPTEQRSFIVDAMLGRLAKALRMLGYDAAYRADIDDPEVKMVALREGRTVLTRDHELAATTIGIEVLLVESDLVEEQLVQVVEAFGLLPSPGLFSRCLVCNVPVDDVPRDDVRDRVPPYVYKTQERFVKCPECGRVYWPATHVERATEWLYGVLGPGSTGENGVIESLAGPEDGGGDRSESGADPAAGRKPARVRNVFVTGRPGVGKTTLIRRVLGRLDADAGGFYTAEIREDGARVGFSIVGLNGERGELARVGLASSFRVGRYGVNRDDLERVGVRALQEAVSRSGLVVMDEIGRMELCSESFRAAVGAALDSTTPVFGTIQDRSNPFLDAVRARADTEVLRVDEGNRDELVELLVERLGELLDPRE
jgi:nucleoside-triphosphatase